MRVNNHIAQALLILGVGTGFVACSNDSGSTAKTGYLNNISGVSYSTATLSGVTGMDGQFEYKDGETVTFSLGDVVLGESVTAKASMNVADLVPNAVLYTTAAAYHKMASAYKDLPWRLGANKAITEATNHDVLNNLLWLLYSVDEDANPDNGINIPSGIADIVNTSNLNISDGYTVEDKLTFITHRAHTQGLLSSASIKPYGAALDDYYRLHNISYNAAIETEIKYENNTRVTYDYNDDFLITAIANLDDSGTTTRTKTWSYDGNGNVLTYKYYSGDTSVSAASTTTSTYDADDNLITISDGAYITEYEYNSDGRLLTQTKKQISDSSIIDTYTYTYDDSGNRLTSLDSSDNEREIYTYDDNGNILTQYIDLSNDGVIDKKYTISYDSNGNRLTQSYEESADDSENYVLTFTYDSNGNLLTLVNRDGAKEIYSYDSLGRLTSYQYDTDGNGNVTYSESLSYDENDNLLTLTRDGGSYVAEYEFSYDDNNNLVTKVFGADTYTYEYNSDGYLIKVSKDSDSDTTIDTITTYTRDANGNLTKISYDNDADGYEDGNQTSTYINANWASILDSNVTFFGGEG